jgi:hypothetical protein
MKAISKLFIFKCLALLGLWSCQYKPDFPKEPQITLDRIDQFFNVTTNGDGLTVFLRYQDGDGDLGLTAEDRATPTTITPQTANKPFQEFKYTFGTNGQILTQEKNKFYFNLFVTTYKKNASGVFEVFEFSDIPISQAFTPLHEGTRRSPMEGTIEYNFLNFFALPFPKGTQFYFEFQIADRALNLSNVVRSEVITLKMEP